MIHYHKGRLKAIRDRRQPKSLRGIYVTFSLPPAEELEEETVSHITHQTAPHIHLNLSERFFILLLALLLLHKVVL